MAIPKVALFPVEIHIYPRCEDDIATGADIDGEPTLCCRCDALNRVRHRQGSHSARARQQKRISGRRKR
jgi:hypothetical protein